MPLRMTLATASMHHPLLPASGLYVVTNGPRPDLLAAADAALRGGAAVLQYRDKTHDAARREAEARMLADLCAAAGALFVVNDDIALARACGARAVHLGADDADIASARRMLGAEALIGVSCYDDLERARRLAGAGANYLAFGAFFPSPTKPGARRADPRLLQESAAIGLPRVAIGGITADNAAPLIAAGADFVAVISAVFGQADVCSAARRFAPLFPDSRKTPA
ncbi:MAG: thiamine-phosphate synthase [Rhodanobacteraceae bacterium]